MTAGPPTPKATKVKKAGRCGHHPRYTGKNAPTKAACPICWGLHLKQKYGITPKSVSAPAIVTLSDDFDVQKLIAGLKNAVLRSRETGGIYSAFAHTKDGSTFQIEVHLPMIHQRGTK